MAHALLARAKDLDLLDLSPRALVNLSLEDYCSLFVDLPVMFLRANVSALLLFLYHAILNILHVNVHSWYIMPYYFYLDGSIVALVKITI
jgi:hypothetical protein